jgi:predicted acyltransferase
MFAAIITLMTKLRGQIAWTVALLVEYWAIMALIPVPGFVRNVLTQQGDLEEYIDRLDLPGKFCCHVFGDNKGYLRTIPSVTTVMLGVLCTHILQAKRSERFKVLALVGGGVASLAVGLAWGTVFLIITDSGPVPTRSTAMVGTCCSSRFSTGSSMSSFIPGGLSGSR